MEDVGTDMSLEMLTETLRQFSELRAELEIEHAWVQLTGGEPLIHPQLSEMLVMTSGRFPTKILTNGTLIDEQATGLLKRYCESVQISFDGTRNKHDTWRGEGSFDAAMRGLTMLHEAGVPVSARMTVGRDNQESIEELFRELSPFIAAFNISRVVPTADSRIDLPDVEVYRRVIYSLYGSHFENPKALLRDPFFGPLMKADYRNCSFTGCSAGISGICVTETGDVYPCRRLPIRIGSINSDRLTELYNDHPLMRSLRKRELSGRCGKCEDKLLCGGSRCVACALTGDPLSEDPGCIFA